MDDLYFIALLPPPVLCTRIDEIRKECSDTHGVFSALKTPVHITLIPPFKLRSSLEHKLLQTLNRARNFNPFLQELEDFGGFPEHTIYIHAHKGLGISNLSRTLRAVLKPFELTFKNSLHPHITIAYRDAEAAYPAILEQYSKRTFRASFMVNHYSLLRHDGKKWNICREYQARPAESQIELFV